MMKIFIKILVLLSLFCEISHADINKFKNETLSSLENLINKKFENTDFKIKATEKNKPEISIQTHQSIIESNNDLTFLQGSFFMHDGDRETLNIGVGKRILTNDENFIFGFNTFYDYEFDYKHKRFGWGTELKSSILELNTNNYYANSGKKIGKDNKEEEALNGYDIEVGAHAPYIPSLKFYTKFLKFDSQSGQDIEGFEYTSELIVPYTGLTFEIGRTDYSKREDNWFLGIKFSSNNNKSNGKLIKRKAYEKISMKNRMHERIRRDNIIKKDISFKFMAGAF